MGDADSYLKRLYDGSGYFITRGWKNGLYILTKENAFFHLEINSFEEAMNVQGMISLYEQKHHSTLMNHTKVAKEWGIHTVVNALFESGKSIYEARKEIVHMIPEKFQFSTYTLDVLHAVLLEKQLLEEREGKRNDSGSS